MKDDGHRHDFVACSGVSVSLLITDMFRLCYRWYVLTRKVQNQRLIVIIHNFERWRPPSWFCWPFRNICVTDDHGYVLFVYVAVLSISSVLFCRRMNCRRNFAWIVWQVVLVDQEMITIPYHLNSHSSVRGVRVARSLLFYVVICGHYWSS